MADALLTKICTPCQGGVMPLSSEQAHGLLTQIPQWTLIEDAHWLKREFHFKNFAKALEFVNVVGNLAEREGHHPDIHLGWGYATILLQTHKIKGLHENDFILAAKIDQIQA
jgi:4a-hydroxytetrahydrobiopterin dehydratase